MTSYYADNYNYETPLQPYTYTLVEFSSSAFFKRIFYEIKTLDHFSDDGIITPDVKTRSKIGLENFKSIFDFRNTDMNGGKVLFQFTYSFNMNGFKETYHLYLLTLKFSEIMLRVVEINPSVKNTKYF